MKKTIKKNEINASLKVMGRVYTAKGKTIEEAITNLKPEMARSVGVLILERGEIRKEKILKSVMVTGLFGKVSRIRKEIALKGVLTLFDKNIFE